MDEEENEYEICIVANGWICGVLEVATSAARRRVRRGLQSLAVHS